ncbi:hypothetical protein [Candidatus Pantoea persica]|uniref:hypothetical protein n=1 Tax=Candidatus Pantoea persica TaxID=2518128 RepID=UPI00215DA9D4|nr:hypothetical protein [Candidatus Pantoea persica]MBA2813990.1 hypothetical protein [Candidatus Pantoea persica]
MGRLNYQIRVVRFLALYVLYRLDLFKFSVLSYTDEQEKRRSILSPGMKRGKAPFRK